MTNKTLLILTDDEGNPNVFDWAVFVAKGKTEKEIREQLTEDDRSADAVEFLTLTLKPPTRGMENDVERSCLVPNELQPGSFRLDGNQIAAQRFRIYVQKWTRSDRISAETFEALHPTIADAVAALLHAHLYPNVSPNFMTVLMGLFNDTTTAN